MVTDETPVARPSMLTTLMVRFMPRKRRLIWNPFQPSGRQGSILSPVSHGLRAWPKRGEVGPWVNWQ